MDVILGDDIWYRYRIESEDGNVVKTLGFGDECGNEIPLEERFKEIVRELVYLSDITTTSGELQEYRVFEEIVATKDATGN